jgi:hypothetical protein
MSALPPIATAKADIRILRHGSGAAHSHAKREAQIECARIITELKTGTFQEPSKLALADFVEQWLDYMKSQVSPATHERYVEIARKNIIPLLGQERLSKLSAVQITQAYTKALEWWSPEWKGRPFPAYRASHAPNSKAGTHESS